MTETLPARPAPISRVWSGGKIIAEDLEGDDLSDVLETHPEASAWWVMERNSLHTTHELRQVGSALELDQLALDDLAGADPRTKVEVLGASRLIVMSAAAIDPDAAVVSEHPVSVLVTDRVLIVTADPALDFHPAVALVEQHSDLASGGLEAGLRLVLTAVVASYESAVRWAAASTEDVFAAVAEGRPLDAAAALRVFHIRAALAHLRLMTEPMEVVLTGVGAGEGPAIRQWRLVAQRQQRVASAADSWAAKLAALNDTSAALAAVEQSRRLRLLASGVTVLGLPVAAAAIIGAVAAVAHVGGPLAAAASALIVVLALIVGIRFAKSRADKAPRPTS